MKPYLLFITGPTGVGKSDIGLAVAHKFPAEIINADVGQFYVPLTIGTAKPDWRKKSVTHHLFDIIAEPRDLSVWEYRKRLVNIVNVLWQDNKLPIIVGGSLFYVQSILFPPKKSGQATEIVDREIPNKVLWQQLHKIDPERAKQIHQQDRYRIIRALTIWHSSTVKPSLLKPIYDPPAPFHLIILTRDRNDLYTIIDERVEKMFTAGWIDEVKPLLNTPWEQFLEKKKLIGYDDIISYLRSSEEHRDQEVLIALIQQKTRKYAKRQMTFLKRLKRSIVFTDSNIQGSVHEVNMTSLGLDAVVKKIERIIGKMHLYIEAE